MRSNYERSDTSQPIVSRDRLDEFNQVILKASAGFDITMFHTKVTNPGHGPIDLVQRPGFCNVAVALNAFKTENLYIDGKCLGSDFSIAGSTKLSNLEQAVRADLHEPFESINLQFPLVMLASLKYENGNAEQAKQFDRIVRNYDEVMLNLARALLPALRKPKEAGTLFLEHIFEATLAHLSGKAPTAIPKGLPRLAPWQESRAKELLLENRCSDISLQTLAQASGLSVTYFARAFKNTVGIAPHRWLTEKRVETSKSLMLGTSLALVEIALMSGFSDQSHFTRIFSKVVGVSPGAWRRLYNRHP
jgi:AraC family transcriptional regulator